MAAISSAVAARLMASSPMTYWRSGQWPTSMPTFSAGRMASTAFM